MSIHILSSNNNIFLGKFDEFRRKANSRTSFCSFKDESDEEILTFDYNFELENNIPGASMDCEEGRFTAGVRGLYQASINMEVNMQSGQTHHIWLSVNGALVDGTGKM